MLVFFQHGTGKLWLAVPLGKLSLYVTSSTVPFPFDVFVDDSAERDGDESVVPMGRKHDEEAEHCAKQRKEPTI